MADTRFETHREDLDRLRQVREEALAHFLKARELHAARQELLRKLMAAGFSQAELARELGVTRQAIQKMLA